MHHHLYDVMQSSTALREYIHTSRRWKFPRWQIHYK